jgi:hypothetical protein
MQGDISMDAAGIDGLARRLAERRARRTIVVELAGALGGGVAGLAGLSFVDTDAKKKKHKHKHKPKHKCKKQCDGTRCGGDDGCGGQCGCTGDAVCHEGSCHACTVTCTGSDVSCGLDLSVALEDGGEVYVCPGRYTGTFTIAKDGTKLVGAGPEADPATNTILDGRGNGTVVTCNDEDNHIAVSLAGVRITGGVAPDTQGGSGGGIAAIFTDLQVDYFSIVDNRAQNGAGIVANQRLRLSNGTIERNIATGAGGGIFLISQESSNIRNVYIANNEAANGGGVFHAGTTLTILGCETSENHAIDEGGGFYQQFGTLTFDEDSRVVENTAAITGGGIFVEDGSNGTVQPNGAEIADNSPNDCRGTTAC